MKLEKDYNSEEEFAGLLRNALGCDPDEFYKAYKKYKKAEEAFKNLYEPFKKQFIQLHADTPEAPKDVIIGGCKLTYVSPSIRSTIDSKKLKEEEPELAKKYTKTTNVSATIRLEEV